MKRHAPRKTEFNYLLQRLTLKAFNYMDQDCVTAAYYLREYVKKIPKKHNVISANIEISSFLTPNAKHKNSGPGNLGALLESLTVTVRRKRSNRSIAVHKIVLSLFPNGYDAGVALLTSCVDGSTHQMTIKRTPSEKYR